jgi:hypothetical protein
MRSVACFALGWGATARFSHDRDASSVGRRAELRPCRINRAGIVPSGARGFCFPAAVFDRMPGKLDWLHDDLEAALASGQP